MRVFALLAFSAAVLLGPAVAAADPAQSQAVTVAQANPATAAQPAAPAATATDATSAGDLDQIVCKSTPPPTGSRIGGGRECHTARQWRQRELDSQATLARQQQGGFVYGPGK